MPKNYLSKKSYLLSYLSLGPSQNQTKYFISVCILVISDTKYEDTLENSHRTVWVILIQSKNIWQYSYYVKMFEETLCKDKAYTRYQHL